MSAFTPLKLPFELVVLPLDFLPAPIFRLREACEVLWWVCLSVSLSVRWHNSKTTRPNFTNFSCMLPVAVAGSSSNGVVIRYVLLVLWMASCFTPWANEWARMKDNVMFRRVRQVAVPAGRQTTAVFGRGRQNAAPGVKSAICNCLFVIWKRTTKDNC